MQVPSTNDGDYPVTPVPGFADPVSTPGLSFGPALPSLTDIRSKAGQPASIIDKPLHDEQPHRENGDSNYCQDIASELHEAPDCLKCIYQPLHTRLVSAFSQLAPTSAVRLAFTLTLRVLGKNTRALLLQHLHNPLATAAHQRV